MSASLVGSEMCIRDRRSCEGRFCLRPAQHAACRTLPLRQPHCLPTSFVQSHVMEHATVQHHSHTRFSCLHTDLVKSKRGATCAAALTHHLEQLYSFMC
eukprot:15442328-Alexandrium_andersonii.AAC.1